jgi:hypothetical protein
MVRLKKTAAVQSDIFWEFWILMSLFWTTVMEQTLQNYLEHSLSGAWIPTNAIWANGFCKKNP